MFVCFQCLVFPFFLGGADSHPRPYPSREAALCGRHHLCCHPCASCAAISAGCREREGASVILCMVPQSGFDGGCRLPPTVSDPSDHSIRSMSPVLLAPASRTAIGMGERDGAQPPSATCSTLISKNATPKGPNVSPIALYCSVLTEDAACPDRIRPSKRSIRSMSPVLLLP